MGASTSALRQVRNERGAVLAIVVLAVVVLVGSAGLAVDLGLSYLERMRIGRAVDAGALAGARVLREGREAARAEAAAVARANGIFPDERTETSIEFATNPRGEQEVVVSARRVRPTIFMGLLGIREVPVAATAVAAVPPLDVVLVLDISGSLNDAIVPPDNRSAFEHLQEAASAFVERFDDQLDQVGLVSFQLAAAELFELEQFFTTPILQEINSISAGGDTNAQEGLRIARERLDSPSSRPGAAKVIVFFTDGQPTATRGIFGGQDRIAAVFRGSPPAWRGYFNNPDALPPFGAISPNGCSNGPPPSCFGIPPGHLRNLAADRGLQEAGAARERGILVYSLGLGNLNADPNVVPPPDLGYLREIANEDGVANSAHPHGKLFFAPTGADLDAAFEELAKDLIVRLAR